MVSQTEMVVQRKAAALRDYLFGVPAVLGRLNADGTLNPNITDGLSGAYVWIRLQDSRAAIPALNINVTNKIAGANVLARLRPDSGWEVMSLDPNMANQQFGTAAGSANQPDRVQEWDTTGVEAYRLVPGRITASSEGGLFVWIEPFIYGRKRWGGLHFLLAAPASPGDRAFAVITFDPAAEDNDDAFSQVWSEDVPANFVVSDIPTYQDAQDYINAATVADGLIVLGGVLLGYGDTAVNVTQIVDVREWVNVPLTGDLDAVNVTYTEADAGDWTASPGTTAAALDEVADRVTALEGGSGGGLGDYLLFTHEEAVNVNGGTATSGSRQVRKLNYKRHDTGTNASIIELAFTSGGTYTVAVGDTITGATSAATATVFDVVLTSGSWAAGDAAGVLWLNGQSGTFQSENLNVGANSNVATIAENSTSSNYRFRLKAGTYRVNGSFQFWDTAQIRIWLYNVSDAADEAGVYGQASYTPSSGSANVAVPLQGRFTLAAIKTLRIEYQCSVTSSTDEGQGIKSNFGGNELYATLRLDKE